MKEIKPEDFPTWEYCDRIYSREVNPPNALERFIYSYEPRANDPEWREDLACLINYVLEKYAD